MWISLLIGFYSAVECAEDSSKVVVRARVREDLVELRRRYVPTLGRVFETKTRDYRYRSVVSKADFAAGLGKAVIEDLTYPNYKAAVHQRDPRRAEVLVRVWGVLRDLQEPAYGRSKRPSWPV